MRSAQSHPLAGLHSPLEGSRSKSAGSRLRWAALPVAPAALAVWQPVPPLLQQSQAQPSIESFSSVRLLGLSENSFSGNRVLYISAVTAFRLDRFALGSCSGMPGLPAGPRGTMGDRRQRKTPDPFPGWPDYKYLFLRRQATSHSPSTLLLRCNG